MNPIRRTIRESWQRSGTPGRIRLLALTLIVLFWCGGWNIGGWGDWAERCEAIDPLPKALTVNEADPDYLAFNPGSAAELSPRFVHPDSQSVIMARPMIAAPEVDPFLRGEFGDCQEGPCLPFPGPVDANGQPLESIPFPGPQSGMSQPEVPLLAIPAPPQPPSKDFLDYRKSFFQRVMFQSTFLNAMGTDSFRVTSLDLRSVFALPFFKVTSPLFITPGFTANFLEEQEPLGLPSQVYDSYIQLRHLRQITEHLGMDLAIQYGAYGDYQHKNSDTYRLTGHGLGAWIVSTDLKLVAGVAYLGRDDIRLLPAGGIIWTPGQLWNFELFFPRPKIARRLNWGYVSESIETQDWLYLAAELGGGTWAIQRHDTIDDVLTYRDYRIILGVEQKAIGRSDFALEVGYVFSRELEFQSGVPNLHPGNTMMIRFKCDY